jgi:prefoldin subunit 5
MLKQEKDYLESEMEGIKNALSDISKRIEDMEKEE